MNLKTLLLILITSTIAINAQTQVEPLYKDARVVNMGKEFNSPDLDYAPYLSSDGTMFFVSNRKGSQLNKDLEASHDIWMAHKKPNQDTAFFEPFNPDPPENKGKFALNSSLNEGAVSISLDKKKLYFTACNRGYGFGDCDIYVANLVFRDDTIGIQAVYNLGRNINSDYWESQPSISPDNKRLYFCSTKGSTAEKTVFDIWYSDYDTVSNTWQPSKLLPREINTSAVENSPFIAADNKTLFFSSDGQRPNYGSTDYYYSRVDSAGKWSKPVNLGKPINTEGKEQFISSNITGDILYISSTRKDIPESQGSMDIFSVTVPSILSEINLVSWQQSEDGDIEISIDNENETVRSFQMGLTRSGRHSFVWDGKDNKKTRVPAGKYYYEVKVNGVQDTQGILLMK